VELALFADTLNNDLCVLVNEEKRLMERGGAPETRREHSKGEVIAELSNL
jgi:hypothetical protein